MRILLGGAGRQATHEVGRGDRPCKAPQDDPGSPMSPRAVRSHVAAAGALRSSTATPTSALASVAAGPCTQSCGPWRSRKLGRTPCSPCQLPPGSPCVRGSSAMSDAPQRCDDC